MPSIQINFLFVTTLIDECFRRIRYPLVGMSVGWSSIRLGCDYVRRKVRLLCPVVMIESFSRPIRVHWRQLVYAALWHRSLNSFLEHCRRGRYVNRTSFVALDCHWMSLYAVPLLFVTLLSCYVCLYCIMELSVTCNLAKLYMYQSAAAMTLCHTPCNTMRHFDCAVFVFFFSLCCAIFHWRHCIQVPQRFAVYLSKSQNSSEHNVGSSSLLHCALSLTAQCICNRPCLWVCVCLFVGLLPR